MEVHPPHGRIARLYLLGLSSAELAALSADNVI